MRVTFTAFNYWSSTNQSEQMPTMNNWYGYPEAFSWSIQFIEQSQFSDV